MATLIAGLVVVSIVVLGALSLVLRKGRGGQGNGLLGLGTVSPQWLQTHRQEDHL